MKRAVLLTLGLFVISCGGGSEESPTETATSASVETTIVSERGTTPAAAPSSGEPADQCEALFSLTELAALFGEAALLEEATMDTELGQLVCRWSTIEDPEDLDDLAVEFITVQLYSGDPIAGNLFYAPEMYAESESLDGIGDAAYIAGDGNWTTGFLDGDVAGFFSYNDTDVGPSGPAPGITRDRAIELLTLFHDRAT